MQQLVAAPRVMMAPQGQGVMVMQQPTAYVMVPQMVMQKPAPQVVYQMADPSQQVQHLQPVHQPQFVIQQPQMCMQPQLAAGPPGGGLQVMMQPQCVRVAAPQYIPVPVAAQQPLPQQPVEAAPAQVDVSVPRMQDLVKMSSSRPASTASSLKNCSEATSPQGLSDCSASDKSDPARGTSSIDSAVVRGGALPKKSHRRRKNRGGGGKGAMADDRDKRSDWAAEPVEGIVSLLESLNTALSTPAQVGGAA